MRSVAIISMCSCVGLLSSACAQGSNEVNEDSTNSGTDAEASVATSADSAASGSTSSDSAAETSTDGSSAFEDDASSGVATEAGAAEGGGAIAGGATEGGGNPNAASSNDGSPASDSGGGGPVIGGCSVFPADNPWNMRVDDTTAYPVHPNSATYIANMSPTSHLHPDWGDWSVDHYGIPWQTVPGSQPFVAMTFTDASESDPGPYPFPPNALVEGGSGSGGDMHVLVLDSGNCMLYETYQSTYVGPGWSCTSGAVFNLSSNALRPDGWTSADAAGLPILPGLVKLSEVQAGSIQHALRFTVSNTQEGYIHPATHAAGTANASLPPMGLRVRLQASFDLSGFSGPALVILTAMQQYGLILADNGGNWFVTGDSNDGWTPLMDAISSAFSQVDGSNFEAVYTGPISTAGL